MGKRVFVAGAGAWGTALGVVAQEAGSDVVLWGRSLENVTEVNTQHRIKYLPGITLNTSIRATQDLSEVAQSDVVILAVPSQRLREVLQKIKPHANLESHFVLACKGIECETGSLMSEVVEEIMPGASVSVLSGPNFAPEIAKTLPTATTLSCPDDTSRDAIVSALNYVNFRLYLSHDVIGVQVGGALKNVVAIACGIAYGYGLGENAMASLITRGLVEIRRLGIKKGAQPETFYGLSGLGDLMLTCMGSQSRNFKLGRSIGRGMGVSDILASTKKTVEGFHTALSLHELSHRLGIEMPICHAVYRVLYEDLPVTEAITSLLERPLKSEEVL